MKHITIAVLALMAVGLAGCTMTPSQEQEISRMGYDTKDVYVFLEYTGAYGSDFINSQGLRKQYELFRDGGSTSFIQAARNHKEVENARAHGQITGMALGMAIGN